MKKLDTSQSSIDITIGEKEVGPTEKSCHEADMEFKKYRGDGAGLFIPADIPADSLEALRVQKVSI